MNSDSTMNNLWAALLGGAALGVSRAPYWVKEYCSRCETPYYTWSEANIGILGQYETRCYWCRGEMSAAEQDFRNLAIEEGMSGK